MMHCVKTALAKAVCAGDLDAVALSLAEYVDLTESKYLQGLASDLLSKVESGQHESSALMNQARSLLTETVTLVGVAGQARMGKDTVGSMLAVRYGLKKRAFAHAVKRVVVECFGFDMSDIEYWKTRNTKPPGLDVTMRETLQRVGDGFRVIKPSVWIDMALGASDTSGVFCDVRYMNEAQELKRRGALLVLIGRTDALNRDANASESSLRPMIEWFLTHTHEPLVDIRHVQHAPSDVYVFDWFVRNDGDVATLGRSLESIFFV